MDENSRSPMFIRIDEHKDIQGIMDVVNKKLKEAKSILNSIYNLKNDEDAELDRWNTMIEEVERKMQDIDNALFEGE